MILLALCRSSLLPVFLLLPAWIPPEPPLQPEGPRPSVSSGSPASSRDAPPPPEDAPLLVREKAYYVPFEELEEVFEKTGRGIFLPYGEFLELWNKAHPTDPPPKDPGPPADVVVRGGTYTGSVAGGVARFEVTYALEALKKGWSEVRLPLRNVAVERVEISNDKALFATQENHGYTVYLPAPGAYELKLTLSVPVSEEPGKKTVHFGIPPTAVSRLDLHIPEQDIRVDVKPSLAVTQTTPAPDATRVRAFLGNSDDVTVSWMPPAGRAAEGAIVSSRQSIHTHLGERIVTISSQVEYEVLRGEVDTLRVQMPADTRILRVQGENMREWSPDGDTLTVRLHSPLKKNYRLALSFERILERTPASIALPFPQTLDVLRESGWAALSYDDALSVRVTNTQGLSQLDPEEVPEALRGHLGVGFRYLAHPVSLACAIEKITPAVRSESVSVISLGREEDRWFGWIDYDIAKAGLFRLEFRVPASWSVDSVGDRNTVEEFQMSDADGERTVTVSLRAKAFGAFRLRFHLTRKGSAGPGELDLSPPVVLGSLMDRGLLGVSAPRAIEVVTLARTRMIDADSDALFRSQILGEIPAEAGIPRAYRYREQPASVRLRLEDKRTEIKLLAQHLVEVSDGRVQVTHFLDYTVLYAPVGVVKFRAPSALDDTLKVDAKQKTQVRKTPDDRGMTLWEVSLQPPALGSMPLTATHPENLEGMESGETLEMEIALVTGADVQAEEGYVAIRKEGTLEIVPRTAMEPVDASELPDKLRRGQISSAFRYFREQPSLTLNLTRYDYQELATTVVEFIHLKSVLSEGRKLRTLATLLVENSERQFLELKLPSEAEILSLSVAGKTQRLKTRIGEEGTLIQIPRSVDVGGAFPIVLSYDEPLASSTMGSFGFAGFNALEVLDHIPVSKVELELYLPPEYTYMGWSGNLFPREERRPSLWERFKKLLGEEEGVAQAEVRGESSMFLPGNAVIPDVLTKNLRLQRFDTMAPAARLRFFYLGNNLYWFVDFLVFVASIVATVVLLRRHETLKVQVGLLMLFAGLVLTWFSQGPVVGFFSSFFFGGLAACGFFVAVHLRGRWGAYRESRLAFAPDPFLEEAPAFVPPPSPSTRGPETTEGTKGGEPIASAVRSETESRDTGSRPARKAKKKTKKKTTRKGK